MKKILNKIILFISLFLHISTYLFSRDIEIDGKKFKFYSSFLVDEDTVINEGSIISQALNDITILVVGKAKLIIEPGRNISKILPNHDNYDETDDYKYGLTSNIVAIGPEAKVVVNSASIYVNCPYSNAIMALNGAQIELNNATIITKTDYSKGLVVAYGGKVNINEGTKIYTEGNFSPCLEVYQSDDAILGINILLNSKGLGSPLINNLGNAKVELFVSNGKAENSQIIINQDINTVYLDGCQFICNVKDINEDENTNLNSALNKAGIVLFSKKDDSSGSTSLQSHHCTLKIENEKIVPLISCYNIEADITFDTTQTEFRDIFIKANKNKDLKKETKVHLTLQNTNFKGKIIAMEDSHIDLIADPNILNNGVQIEGKVDFQ